MPKLDWIGKDKVISHHLDVPVKVLDHKYGFRPNSDDKSETGSGNMIIHGDNLEALKALLPKFESRVSVIYADPPYNTGKENWVYNDNVNDPRIQNWLGKVVGNETDDFSRHDKWLCMMYPRLKLMHQLLAEDGVIFLSIDDNEQESLKLLCQEVFGRQNFIAQVVWERAYSPVNLKKHFSESHDYILCFAKDINQCICNGLPRNTAANGRYSNPDDDPRGVWKSSDFSVGPAVEENIYPIETPSGRIVLPPSGRSWLLSKDRYKEFYDDNRIWFGTSGNNVPAIKKFLSEVKQGITPMTIWKYEDVGHSQDATKELKAIFGGEAVFTYPKPSSLIAQCLRLYSNFDSIILDPFAGSGTTGHAVLKLNNEDKGNRKFILCEMCDYAEDITAERIRRVMNGYGEGNNITNGTGGSFDFYELGEKIFAEDGNLNEKISEEKIREYIYYSETRQSLTRIRVKNSFLLDTYNNTGIYFYYKPNEVTTFGPDTLNIVTEKADSYVIYADRCTLSEDYMLKHNIVFKKIPRDIKKF